MGLYVKDMEMPNCCPSCPFNYETYWLSRHICVANKRKEIHVNLDTGFPDDCPLVEVKAPHGDLIDRDALKSEWKYDKLDGSFERSWVATVRRSINQISTVIKAERKHGTTDIQERWQSGKS